LVSPLPHASSCHAVGALYYLPLSVVVLERHSEGVAVFGEELRAVGVLIEACELTGFGVVGRIDVDECRPLVVVLSEVASHLRVAHRACVVECLHSLSHLLCDRCQGVLVSYAPYHHAGAVFVACHCCVCPCEEYVLIAFLREVLFSSSERHLVNDIEAQRVGEVVEARLAGVVGGSDIVYRCLFHHFHVLECQLVADYLHCLGVGGVCVHSTEFHLSAVDAYYLAVNGDFPYSELLREVLHCLLAFCGGSR